MTTPAGIAAPAPGTVAAPASTDTADDGLPAPSVGSGAGARLSDEDLIAGIETELDTDAGAGDAAAKPTGKAAAAKPSDKDPKKEGEAEVEVKLDAAASKSIEATNRYRAQVERKLGEREASITRRETDLAPRLAKLDAHEKALASRDPEAVAHALGYGPEEYEVLAQSFYRLSKSASPADRAAAAQLVKQRQTGTDVQRLEKTIEELKQTITQRDQQQQQQAFVREYTAQITSGVVPAEHALVANALKNAPQDAQRELLQLAARMEAADPRKHTPAPADVLKTYEQLLRRQAQALGFDPSKLGQHETTTTPTPENNGQKKTTAGLTQDLGPQTRSRAAPKTRDEAFDETERELAELERKNRRT